MPQFNIPASFLVDADTREAAVEVAQSLIVYGLEVSNDDGAIVAAGADTPDSREPNIGPVNVGALFRSKFPELDGADDSEIGVNRYVGRDGERWTPGGSVWRVVDVSNAPDVIGITCDETGAYINPSEDELLDTESFTSL